MKDLIVTFLFPLFCLLISCDRPRCTNMNSTFDRYSPETSQYRKEVAQQLRTIGRKELSYWFDEYKLTDQKEYIVVDIQGRDVCAKGFINVNDWTGLENIKRTKGIGYRGAQLIGFEIGITEGLDGTYLVFQGIDNIVD